MISTTKERRPAIRAALDIHGNLAGTHVTIDELPQAAWEELRRNVSQLQRAIARGWRVAGQSLLNDLDYGLQRMARELDSYRQELPPPYKSPVSFTPSEILADLGALEDEFDDVSLDLQARTISVRTGPIEL